MLVYSTYLCIYSLLYYTLLLTVTRYQFLKGSPGPDLNNENALKILFLRKIIFSSGLIPFEKLVCSWEAVLFTLQVIIG